MNEAYVTGKLAGALREGRAGKVFKHCDRVTSGIPDVSVTNGHGTCWLEVKLTRCPRTTLSEIRVGQHAELQELEHAGGNVWYMIFFRDGSEPATLNPLEIEIAAPQGQEKAEVYTVKPARSRALKELVTLVREGRYDEI